MAVVPEVSAEAQATGQSLKDWLSSYDPTGGKIVNFGAEMLKGMTPDPQPLAYTRAVPWIKASKIPGIRVLPGEVDKFKKFLTEAARDLQTDYSLVKDTGISNSLENLSFIDREGSLLGGRSWNTPSSFHHPLTGRILTEDPNIRRTLFDPPENLNKILNDYQMVRVSPPTSAKSVAGLSVELPMNANQRMLESVQGISEGRGLYADLVPYQNVVDISRNRVGYGFPGKNVAPYPVEDLNFTITNGNRSQITKEYMERMKAYESWLEKQIGSAQFNKLYRR